MLRISPVRTLGVIHLTLSIKVWLCVTGTGRILCIKSKIHPLTINDTWKIEPK